jgi:hypothetical protein
MNQSLFRKTSLEGISSPDQLNDYIKVSNPRIWMVLAALFILLAAVFVWGFAGSLPTTVRCEGVVLNGSAVCYVSTQDADQLRTGQPVTAVSSSGEIQGQVSQIASIPLSSSEIAAELNSDYLLQALINEVYAVKINITLDQCNLTDKELLDIRIVTDAVRPIDFLLK